MPGTSLDVPLPTPVPAYACSALVRDLIKYILYMRQQIPCTYDDFKRSVQEDSAQSGGLSRRGPRASSLDRRRLKLVQSAEALFQALDKAFASGMCVSSVMISLGSSPVSPREVYIVKFANEWSLRGPAAATAGFCCPPREPEAADADRAREYSRRMIRALVVADLDVFQRDLGTTKLAVLLRSPSAACSPAADLFPRQNFSLPASRRRPPPVEIRIGAFPSQQAPSAGSPMSASRVARAAAVKRRTVVLRAGLDDGEDLDRALGSVVAGVQLHEAGPDAGGGGAGPPEGGGGGGGEQGDPDGGEMWFQFAACIQGFPVPRAEQ